MTQGKISIIVPIYNAEDSLKRCIKSILSQTYKNIEVILVNDGSTDKSLEICEQFREKDNRVVIIDKKNAGVSAARNSGICAASGNYIQFVDSDDYIDPNMCERLIYTMHENDTDAVICGYNRLDRDKVTRKNPFNNTSENLGDFKDSFAELYEKALFNAPWNKLYKKEKIKEYFNEHISIGEDLLFNLSYFSNCDRISIMSDCLYNYDVASQEGLASKYDENLFNIELMLHKKVKKFLIDSFKTDDTECINRVFAKELYYYLKKLVILSNENKKIKLQKMRDCKNNKYVQEILYDTDIDDNQIKILCFLLRKNMFESIFIFFKLKEMISNKSMH